MKKGIFIAILALLCIHPDLSHAGGEAPKIVVAVEAQSQTPIASETLLTTGTREKIFVDKQNLKIILGPESVGEFSGQGIFRLLRGTAYFESKEQRSFSTTNAKVEFIGRVLVSFDHNERSSSIFAIAGEARIKNPFESERTILVTRNQGASLITGDVYPTLVRGLDLNQTDSWLKGFNWSEARRAEFLKDVPRVDELKKMLADQTKPTEEKNGQLADYFSSVYEPETMPKKYDEYKDEKQPVAKEEVVISPEHAAIISLPETHFDLGFADVLKDEEVATEPHMPVAEPKPRAPKRSIASLPKPAKPAAPLSPEAQALENLQRLESARRAGGTVSRRAPASVSESAPAPKPRSVVPDPVYDLSENF